MTPTELLDRVIDLYINPFIVILFGLAVLYFIWGVYKYWIGSEGDENRRQGARHILWSIIGIVIMIGVFALMGFISNTLKIPEDQRPDTISL
jgi:hypothetical protein